MARQKRSLDQAVLGDRYGVLERLEACDNARLLSIIHLPRADELTHESTRVGILGVYSIVFMGAILMSILWEICSGVEVQ